MDCVQPLSLPSRTAAAGSVQDPASLSEEVLLPVVVDLGVSEHRRPILTPRFFKCGVPKSKKVYGENSFLHICIIGILCSDFHDYIRSFGVCGNRGAGGIYKNVKGGRAKAVDK